jgi:hypothetical protein
MKIHSLALLGVRDPQLQCEDFLIFRLGHPNPQIFHFEPLVEQDSPPRQCSVIVDP